MYKLAEFLSNNPQIVNVDLCYNNFGDDGMKILSQHFLMKANNIRHLNLIGCSLGGEGMESLYLAAETLKLVSLRVNGNNLGNQVKIKCYITTIDAKVFVSRVVNLWACIW